MADDSRQPSRARDAFLPRRLTHAPRPVIRPRMGPAAEDIPSWPRETLDAFLDELSKWGNVSRACAQVGLCRGSIYALRARDPEFASRWDAAITLGTERLIDEARRRAAEGTVRPVFYKGRRAVDVVLDEEGNVLKDENGEPVTRPAGVREYSDRLLELLLKRHFPEFRERHQHEISGPEGGPVQTTNVDLNKLPLERKRLLLEILREAARDAVDVESDSE